MHQVKIFKSVENELDQLEQEVNDWLAKSDVRVVNMFGNIAPQSHAASQAPPGLTRSEFPPSDVLLVVLYERD